MTEQAYFEHEIDTRDAKSLGSSPTFELRVLTGPQAGAVMPLQAGATLDVASLSAGDCHLALRDPRVTNQRLRLHMLEPNVRIEVLAGAVDLAGQVLEAPCLIDWPTGVALRIGDTTMAVGKPGSAQWREVLANAEAQSLAASEPTPEPASLRQAEAERTGHANSMAAAATPVEAGSRPRRRPEAWLAMAGGFMSVVAAVLLMFSSAVTTVEANPRTELQRLRALLSTPAYRGLSIELGHQAAIVIRGSVLTLADRAGLDRALAQTNIAADVDVLVGEQIAQSVRNVYRIHGVIADVAQPTSLDEVGSVQLRTASSDLERLAQVEAAAQRDVRGLKALRAHNAPPPRVTEASPVPDDPGKRIASVVPGDTPYIVTADGTRYFVGAMLPTGHRLAAIQDSDILLERDGNTLPLKF